MAISKAMRAALKALSYPDIDIKKTYKLERTVENLTAKKWLKLPNYQTWDQKVSVDDHEIPVRIYTLPGNIERPLLLFFHGGGWVTGNIDTYDSVCQTLAERTGHVVASVDYRLAPEFPFPAALEDCYAIAREIFLHGTLAKVPPERITLIGDSAGGNLAAAVSLLARDRGEFLPRRQILIYPALGNDHSEGSPYASVRENGTDYLLTAKRVSDFMKLYAGTDENLQNPYLAPLLADDLSDQPQTLLITAQYCPLRDEGEAYGKKLKQAGNEVEIHRMPDALHGYFSLPPRFVLVERTYTIINQFLKEVNAP